MNTIQNNHATATTITARLTGADRGAPAAPAPGVPSRDQMIDWCRAGREVLAVSRFPDATVTCCRGRIASLAQRHLVLINCASIHERAAVLAIDLLVSVELMPEPAK